MTVICLICRRPIPADHVHTCPGGPSQEMLEIDSLIAERDEAQTALQAVAGEIVHAEKERDDWKARCEKERDKARDQIARLREWLEWTKDFIPDGNSENLARIDELLKETQP